MLFFAGIPVGVTGTAIEIPEDSTGHRSTATGIPRLPPRAEAEVQSGGDHLEIVLVMVMLATARSRAGIVDVHVVVLDLDAPVPVNGRFQSSSNRP